MEITGDTGMALARLAELRAQRAAAEARLRERDAGPAGASSEVQAQRKAAAESDMFVSAQKLVWTGGILKAEGATAGTTVDIRV